MNVVLDSNVLFSALIKNSLTRKLILEYEGVFLFPEYVFEEIEEHKQELLEKSKMDEKDFNALLQLILNKVSVVPKEVLLPFKNYALNIMKNIDVDDALFVACALAHPGSIIWSDDKKLKEKQNQVKVLNTKEIITVLR